MSTKQGAWRGELVKVAMVRDAGYLVGMPAPMRLNCRCGAAPLVESDADVRCACGKVYTSTGWLVS